MNQRRTADITRLLAEWQAGKGPAANELIVLVYDELHRLARRYLRREARHHSLQPTALINEVYLRLALRRTSWKNRAHFFGVAATAMRRILIDHARQRRAAKRGAGAPKTTIDEEFFVQWTGPSGVPLDQLENLLAVDEALTKLADADPQQAQIVELRFFAGLTSKEIAEVLHIGERTVDREWAAAQAWLYGRMRPLREPPSGATDAND